MVEVRPATPNDSDNVCRFLHQHMDPAVSPERFGRLFTYPWMETKPDYGFVLLDDGRLVGYISTIYADRQVNGEIRRFCNLSSWFVLTEYRNHSLKLLAACHKDRMAIYTNLTARPVVQKISEALRYKVLGVHKLFTFPFTHLFTLARLREVRITLDPHRIAGKLNEENRVILRDHLQTCCGHLLLEEGDRSCYVVWVRRVKKSIPFSEVLYISDTDLFRRHLEAIRLRVVWHDKSLALAVDERLVKGRIRLAFPVRRITLYKPPGTETFDIDNLYTELALL